MNFDNWKWLNESNISIKNNELTIYAPPKTDWFRNPIPNSEGTFDKPVANAPFFYTEVKDDFVFSTKVKPNHKNKYDAATLMVIENETLWVKLAFETTDFDTNAIICVVTDEFSDDAVSCDINQNFVYLKIARKGNTFSTHYSLDGEDYHLVRLFRFNAQKTIKLGFGAQSPTGNGGDRVFSDIKLEHKTVENLRVGI